MRIRRDVRKLPPVDEDGDGEGHDEDEEQHDGNHLVDGDGLCRREKLFIQRSTRKITSAVKQTAG